MRLGGAQGGLGAIDEHHRVALVEHADGVVDGAVVESKGYTDTEILMHSLSYELQGEGVAADWRGVFSRLAEKFDGAYNIVMVTASGDLVVVRDPLGFRPLCIAEDGPLFAAASDAARATGQP